MLQELGYNPKRSDMTSKTKPTAAARHQAAQALGRLGGSAGTVAQNRARKRNAQLGGRPRRVCDKCGEPVTGGRDGWKHSGHVKTKLDDTCGQHGWHWQKKSEQP